MTGIYCYQTLNRLLITRNLQIDHLCVVLLIFCLLHRFMPGVKTIAAKSAQDRHQTSPLHAKSQPVLVGLNVNMADLCSIWCVRYCLNLVKMDFKFTRLLPLGHRRAVSIACGQTSSMVVLDSGDVSFQHSQFTHILVHYYKPHTLYL